MKILPALCLTLSLVTTPLLAGEPPPLSIVAKGVEIDAGSAGKFVLEPPELTLADGSKEKPVFEVLSDSEGTAQYPSGAAVTFQTSTGEIRCRYEVPDDAKSLMFVMFVPMRFNQGGTFSFGGEAREFPADLDKQHVATGKGSEPFTLLDPQGTGLEITAPIHWQAVQDNRKFGWPIFVYQALRDVKASPQKDFVFSVSAKSPE
jgi:hypothetical protein